MADKRFFSLSEPMTIENLANISQAEVAGEISNSLLFCDVAALSEATENQVSFLDNKKYIDDLSDSKAGVCVIDPDFADRAPPGMALLLTKQPYHGYALIARAFHPDRVYAPQIHENSTVDPSAIIGDNVTIEAGVVISENVTIGDYTRIGANTVLDRAVSVGDHCNIGANVVLQCCKIGDRVILHPGICIGQDGFGFALGAGGHLKVPQLGRVIIEDDVEIGANSTIDRGAGPDTIIGAGTKIDNLVQIGHNVKIGQASIIVSQTGISGSTKIGSFVMVGGQVGIAGHLEIGDGAQIAAKSGLMRNVAAGSKVAGIPAQPIKDWFRSIATLGKLTKMKKG